MPVDRVCLGAIVGAHGVRGLVKVKAFTDDPAAVAAYGPLGDEAGDRAFDLEIEGQSKGLLIARIAGISDRDAAETLKGTRLYVDRAALPTVEEEDTYYHADLIGLRAEDADGATLGEVVAVRDFGAGDILEVRLANGGTEFYPFTRAAVPEVDIGRGRIVIDAPEEIVVPPQGEDGDT